MVANFINSLVPLLANIFIFYGANLILVSLTHADFTTFIMKCLTPATFWLIAYGVIFLIVTLGNLLWLIALTEVM